MRRWLVPAALTVMTTRCTGTGETFPTPPAEVLSSPDAIRTGEALYERSCTICHGSSGHGDGPQSKGLSPAPSDLRNLQGMRAERGYWFLRIKRGGKDGPLPRERSAMPAWGDHLSDAQIWDLVAYLNALEEGRT
jgi:mono/diheme cytochrome c family protein